MSARPSSRSGQSLPLMDLTSSPQLLLQKVLAMGCGLSCLKASLTVEGRRYKVVRKIGEGGFSTVDLVEDVESGKKFALKRIVCHSTEDQNTALQEVKVTRGLSHRHIVRVVGSCTRGRADIHQNLTSEVLIVFPLYKVFPPPSSWSPPIPSPAKPAGRAGASPGVLLPPALLPPPLPGLRDLLGRQGAPQGRASSSPQGHQGADSHHKSTYMMPSNPHICSHTTSSWSGTSLPSSWTSAPRPRPG